MSVCYIALGSNLGDPRANLDVALDQLARSPHADVTRVSTYYTTSPAGGPPNQPSFLNAAAAIATKRDPFEVLDDLQQIEQRLGRQRRNRWEARILDLDLLLYEGQTIDDPRLQIPHPRMHFRRFVLEPLSEIAPGLRHPVMGWTIRELLENLLRRPLYLALGGPPASGKTTLARRIARLTGAHLICQPPPPPLAQRGDRRDPSRHDPRLWVQYLETCAEVLNRRRRHEQSGWIISDYWLDQVGLARQQRLPKSQFQRYHRDWQIARDRALSATLVAWLDAPTEVLLRRCPGHGAGSEPLSAASIDQQRAEAIRYIEQQQPAPVVRLTGNDLDAAERDILAAIQAAAG